MWPKSSTDRAYDRSKFLQQRTVMMQEYADYLDKTYWQALQQTDVPGVREALSGRLIKREKDLLVVDSFQSPNMKPNYTQL